MKASVIFAHYQIIMNNNSTYQKILNLEKLGYVSFFLFHLYEILLLTLLFRYDFLAAFYDSPIFISIIFISIFLILLFFHQIVIIYKIIQFHTDSKYAITGKMFIFLLNILLLFVVLFFLKDKDITFFLLYFSGTTWLPFPFIGYFYNKNNFKYYRKLLFSSIILTVCITIISCCLYATLSDGLNTFYHGFSKEKMIPIECILASSLRNSFIDGNSIFWNFFLMAVGVGAIAHYVFFAESIKNNHIHSQYFLFIKFMKTSIGCAIILISLWLANLLCNISSFNCSEEKMNQWYLSGHLVGNLQALSDEGTDVYRLDDISLFGLRGVESLWPTDILHGTGMLASEFALKVEDFYQWENAHKEIVTHSVPMDKERINEYFPLDYPEMFYIYSDYPGRPYPNTVGRQAFSLLRIYLILEQEEKARKQFHYLASIVSCFADDASAELLLYHTQNLIRATQLLWEYGYLHQNDLKIFTTILEKVNKQYEQVILNNEQIFVFSAKSLVNRFFQTKNNQLKNTKSKYIKNAIIPIYNCYFFTPLTNWFLSIEINHLDGAFKYKLSQNKIVEELQQELIMAEYFSKLFSIYSQNIKIDRFSEKHVLGEAFYKVKRHSCQYSIVKSNQEIEKWQQEEIMLFVWLQKKCKHADNNFQKTQLNTTCHKCIKLNKLIYLQSRASGANIHPGPK